MTIEELKSKYHYKQQASISLRNRGNLKARKGLHIQARNLWNEAAEFSKTACILHKELMARERMEA